ncbi:class I adenylate-forming enzyme family protein [Oceanobacillus longus]|uniref:Class I adenylate-forming enzyme family protein n=1 Tax=Oceanobacillus longus TaxID=930120 RepID=A0ABV8GZP2_9BACI
MTVLEIIKKELFGRKGIKVFRDRPFTMLEIFEKSVTKYKDKEVLIKGNESLTYGEFFLKVNNLAAVLQGEYGIRKGDRIATIIGNSMEFPIILFASLKIGAIMVPVNVRLSKGEITYVLQDSSPSLIMMDQVFRENIDVSKVDESILVDMEQNNLYQFDYSIKLKEADIDEEDAALIMYTSGTTGRPKGAILSHVNIIHNLMVYQDVCKTNATMKTIIAIPIFHVSGLIGQFLHVFYVGGTSIILEHYKNDDYIEEIIKHKANSLSNVPSIFMMMQSSPKFKKYSFDFVTMVGYGGAPIYKETIETLRKAFPNATFQNVYGATETASPTTLMPREYPVEKANSIGIPSVVTDIKIINEKNEECEVDEEGEILIKGPMVIKGYWNKPEENENSFLDGYWKSGDIVKKDKDGYFYILDRKKNMINRAGEKIYSIEVEDVLKNHPEVEDTAVIGVPHPVYGEQVKCFIVSKTLNEKRTEEIRDYCGNHIARYKVPAIYEFVEDLPRNASGKVLKHILK